MPMLFQILASRNISCTCGHCLLPVRKKAETSDEEKIDALSIPYYVIKMGTSRGAILGKTQEQCDHFKADASVRHARNKGHSSSLERLKTEDSYRNSQTAIGWTEEKRIYLDSLFLEDTKYTATKRERSRYSK